MPIPKNPKRNTHANIDIAITIFIPYLRKKNGINKIHNVSLICDNEINALALLAPHVDEYSDISANPLINGLAKPLVIWSETPRNIEKIKNNAICLSLNSLNASSPSVCTNDFFPALLLVGHFVSVSEYNAKIILKTPDVKS